MQLSLHRRARGAVLGLPLGVLLSGCAGVDVGTVLKGNAGALAQTLIQRVESRSAAASPNAPSALLAAPGTPPLVTRSPVGLSELYNRREVNGRELIDELVAIRRAMKEQRTARAVASFMGSLDAGSAQLLSGGSPGFDWKKLAGDAALKLFESVVAQQAQSIGYQALDDYLNFLINDPKLLPAERITLPSLQGLSAQQLQRGATMAALVVATRVTGKVLKQAQADFAGLEGEYAELMARREEAAKLLYTVLSERRGAGLERDFNGADLNYLRDNVQRMTAQQFANDLGAQNLALQHLKRANPKSFEGYQAKADGLTGRTRGLLRTSSGVLAFGALLANFSQSVVAVAKDKNVTEIIALLPMGMDFVAEAPPLVKHAFEAGSRGVEVLSRSNKRFRLLDAEGKATELARAAEVFEALKAKGEPDALLGDALFRDGAPGLIYRVFQCDKAEAGRLLDTAVPAAERDRFAATYLSPDELRFSFANVFEAPRQDHVREQELGDELLRRDHRRTTDERTRAFSALQSSVTRGYAQWGDEQLMRVIFANREGQAQHATLQLGDVRLRPVPNMQSIYAYESLIDGCRESATGVPLAPAAPRTPARPAKPAAPKAKAKPAPNANTP